MAISMSRERIAAMVLDHDLVKSIERLLVRRGVPDSEVPDLLQEAFMAAFLCPKLPESDAAARKYLFGIVRNKAKMLLRSWRERNFESFDEELHGGSEPAPFEVRDLLRKIVAQVPESRWQTFMWFTRVTFGESLAEVARQEGVDYPAAHARYTRLRADLRRWGAQIAATLVVLFVLFGACWILFPQPDNVTAPNFAPEHDEPLEAPTPEPSGVPSSPPASLRDQAVDLRRKALEDCQAKRWRECQQHLDEAAHLDPAGDADPQVQDLEKRVRAHLVAPRPPAHDKP
jgi:DNA-directed RNA polymerase specialized sigma24 family protein